MQKIKITCDSTCDLSSELYEKYDISAIPLGVTLGDDFHHDGVDVTGANLLTGNQAVRIRYDLDICTGSSRAKRKKNAVRVIKTMVRL